MSIKKAVLSDLNIVKRITELTISEIYPHYYPKGAVEYFLELHNENNIADAETLIMDQYSEIILAASLPAKKIYEKRGYKNIEFHSVQVNYNDFLCYDIIPY